MIENLFCKSGMPGFEAFMKYLTIPERLALANAEPEY